MLLIKRQLIGTICALTLCYPLTAPAESQEQLDALRHRIQLLQKNTAAREQEKQDATDALQKTEHAISTINRKIHTLLKEKQQADQQYTQLTQQQAQLKKDILLEQKQLDQLLYQQYLNNQQDHLKLLLNQQNPNQIMRNMHYYKQLSLARTAAINTLHSNRKKLEDLTQIIRQKRTEITAIQNEYLTQKEHLTQQQTEHQAVVSSIAKKIEAQRNELTKLQRDEKRIANIVTEINKFLTQEKNSSVINNNELPQKNIKHVAFPSLKGKLNLPVRGKLVSRFGGQRSGKHITWKGLFISAPSGSEIKAIADGKVVFSDWLRGFGNLLIVDHGDSYLSLYGNNQALYKEVGDMIQSGDTIATVGNSGGNPVSGLYFELRHQGQPFDPLTWITTK